MAENETKLKVTADVSDAQQKLDSLGKTKIAPISIQSKFDATAFGSAVKSLKQIQEIGSRLMGLFGWFGLAANGVMALVNAFKWLRDKMTETARASARLRWDLEMGNAARETNRLVSAHERLANVLKDELDTLSRQQQIGDMAKSAKRDVANGRREADRARQIYEATSPEQEQALRDRFAAEDERRARDEAKQDRTDRITNLDEQVNAYQSKIRGLVKNQSDIIAQITEEEFNKKRAIDEKDKAAIAARIKSLEQRKRANEEEIATYEKEAKFRRDQIAILQSIADETGPTAGDWQRKTEAKKRAEQDAKAEAAAKANAERESAREAERVQNEKNREAERQAASYSSYAEKLAAVNTPSKNRLTAMGLGDGLGGSSNQTARDVARITQLAEQILTATRQNKPVTSTAIFAP